MTTVLNEWAVARNILIMRLDNIGDVVMTGPALRAIKRALPEACLTLMASPAGAQAAPLLPWIDDVLVWRVLWQDLGHLDFDPQREWQLVETLGSYRFDAAIILTSFSQSPYPPAFICHLAGISLRLGESKEQGKGMLSHGVAAAPDALHQVERNLRLVESVGFSVRDRRLAVQIPAAAFQSIGAKLAPWGHGIDEPYFLLSPWASCPARTYFPERFATAARDLALTTGWPVLVTGSPKERARCQPLLDILGEHAIDLVGETTIPEFAALVKRAQLVLTNDSLPMHLADAAQTPSVVLYSGTELESQWRPRYAPHRLLRRPTTCSPCYAFTCRYNLECLDFAPSEVVAAGLQLLQS